jgi:ParB/RepB/Spo0J family partition protein
MNASATSFRGLRFSLQEIPLDQVDRDPTQPRKTFNDGSIRELAESIRENGGLIQLPVVKVHPAHADRFMIVAGERRIRALRLNGIKKFFMNVVSGVTNTFRWSYVENLLREDLNKIEEAQAMKQNHDEGMTWEQVAALSGKSISTVLKRVKLLDLPDEIQQMIINDQLPSVERVLSLAQYKNTDKGQLIRLAHALIAGEELADFTGQKLLRRDQHVLRFMPGTPEGLLRRVLDFGWRTRGATVAMAEFCKLPKPQRREIWQILERTTRTALFDRATELQESIGAFLAAVRELNGDGEAQAKTPQPQPFRPGKDMATEHSTPTRQPITISSGQPPISLQIKRLPQGRVERLGLVVRFLLENAERHSKVNLSRQRLKSVYACDDPDETALNALRVLRANWDEDPKSYRGPARTFLELKNKIRSDFRSETFEEAMGKAWMQDATSDPVNLALV